MQFEDNRSVAYLTSVAKVLNKTYLERTYFLKISSARIRCSVAHRLDLKVRNLLVQ